MVQDTHARSTRKQQLLVVGTCSLCGKSCYEQQYDTPGCYRDDTNNAQHTCITTCAHNTVPISQTSTTPITPQSTANLIAPGTHAVAARYDDNNKLTPAGTEPACRTQLKNLAFDSVYGRLNHTIEHLPSNRTTRRRRVATRILGGNQPR